MTDLKIIIQKLSSESFDYFAKKLLSTKGDNFHYLATSYREGKIKDAEIIQKLNVNSSAFYALKSRLHTKLKDHLTNDDSSNEKISMDAERYQDQFYNQPREVTISYLEKKEIDFKKSEMHVELLHLYSIFKKVHYKSDKYYQFTQQYNKQLAFVISLEKSESTLADFNFHLTQYLCSRSTQSLDRLFFLKNEILNHQKLNTSKQIELIKNIIEMQLWLFCDVTDKMESFDFENVMEESRKIIDNMSENNWQKAWHSPLDYLSFEYYRSHNPSKTGKLLEQLDGSLENLLLYADVVNVGQYPLSRIAYLGNKKEITKDGFFKSSNLNKDPFDIYSEVCLAINHSIESFINGKLKESVQSLNKIINQYSFKDYIHINIELKLMQSFYYIEMKEFEMADALLKSVYRKLKSENITEYEHIFHLIKAFTGLMDGKSKSKTYDSFSLFHVKNSGRHCIFPYFIGIMKPKFSKS